jgi:hypothetical protein
VPDEHRDRHHGQGPKKRKKEKDGKG